MHVCHLPPCSQMSVSDSAISTFIKKTEIFKIKNLFKCHTIIMLYGPKIMIKIYGRFNEKSEVK